MNDRIHALREASLAEVPRVDMERARLLTEAYQRADVNGASVPVQRALCFRAIMEGKRLYVGEGELIVGERGPEPSAVPTYPEICTHSMQDLDLLDSREKVSYKVSPEARREHEESILPFWRGRSQRELIFREMTQAWIDAYEAGIFTEFQEQRTPGHTALGDKIFRKGFLEIKDDIRRSLAAIEGEEGALAADRREELRAMDVAADAIITFANRYADLLEQLSRDERDEDRRAELAEMARVCRRVPAHAPRTFHEALQCYWFVHVGVITELNPWDSFNPGRLDQHLYPFYERETSAGTLTEGRARELLQAFWVKFHNHPAPPKVGVTAAESGTYTDFSLINVGGVTPEGEDAVNPVTYLILDVVEEMRILQPSSMIQVSAKNPDAFIRKAIEIIKTGFGQPSVFNTDAIVQELVSQGKAIEDARAGGASGCVESGAFGKEAYFLSGYFNIPKVIEITLNDGTDPRTGKRIGAATGDVRTMKTFDEFYEAFDKQLRHFVDIKIRGNNVIERLYAAHMPVPFQSLVIDDCVENGLDYHCGGARYNTTYIQGVGLGSATDALSSIKHNVYERGAVSMGEMLEALLSDFESSPSLRATVAESTPRYGNDDDAADEITVRLFESYYAAVNGRPNARGGVHRINLLPTTVHVYFGSVTGALPDGRRAGETLSEGISPVQGKDLRGPTAVLNSAAKIDHLRTGGTLLNQKLTPALLDDEKGVAALVALVRTYFRKRGHHVQFNVVTRETLMAAKNAPQEHRDLIVRVAGYGDYFVNLVPALQNEIIERTEQHSFSS